MTFIAVYELKKRYPSHRIYVLSEVDLQSMKNRENPYSFDFIGWYPMKFVKSRKSPIKRLLYSLKYKKEYTSFYNIYSDCDMMVDVSGYAFGSIWSEKINTDFLNNFITAKAFGIPFYIMPQTFGPINFDENRKYIFEQAKEILSHAERICAREKDSYDVLTNQMQLDNVSLDNDLVLCNKGIDIDAVFKNAPDICVPEIEDNAVCIIPNSMNSAVGGDKKTVDTYIDCIDICLEKGYCVYIIGHSSCDAELCRELKRAYDSNERVILLDRELDCIEFNSIISKFVFVIASRFHAVVHSYKNRVPCIVIGWSEKYKSLCELFCQGQYMFDVRNEIKRGDLALAISNMGDSADAEREKIEEVLERVQRENIFDILPDLSEKQ